MINKETSTEELPMETETPKNAPILEIAWTRFAQLDASSLRRTRAHKRVRVWIAILGVLATLFAIIYATWFNNVQSVPALIIKFFFVMFPLVASALAAFG